MAAFLIFLKYFALALANGLALAGAWLVEFTEASEGHRKKLTKWGRIALPITVISGVIALILLINADVAEAEKARKDEAAQAQQNSRLNELLGLLQKKQDSEFADTSRNLDGTTLTPEENLQINDLYTKRRILKDEWEQLYRKYSELNKGPDRLAKAFDRQQITVKMGEIAQEIESILDRLSVFEKKPRETYQDKRPPLPPGGLRRVP